MGFNWPPRNWANCDGQLLAIAQNQSLFSLIGNVYGGDGVTTFALPDMRGRVAVHQGHGSGLNNYVIGESIGAEAVTLTTSQLPAHNHTGSGTIRCTDASGDQPSPVGNYLAIEGLVGAAPYHIGPSTDLMAADGVNVATNNTGGGQSHNNLQPLLVLNYIICLDGLYPSRN